MVAHFTFADEQLLSVTLTFTLPADSLAAPSLTVIVGFGCDWQIQGSACAVCAPTPSNAASGSAAATMAPTRRLMMVSFLVWEDPLGLSSCSLCCLALEV